MNEFGSFTQEAKTNMEQQWKWAWKEIYQQLIVLGTELGKYVGQHVCFSMCLKPISLRIWCIPPHRIPNACVTRISPPPKRCRKNGIQNIEKIIPKESSQGLSLAWRGQVGNYSSKTIHQTCSFGTCKHHFSNLGLRTRASGNLWNRLMQRLNRASIVLT